MYMAIRLLIHKDKTEVGMRQVGNKWRQCEQSRRGIESLNSSHVVMRLLGESQLLVGKHSDANDAR